MDFKNKFLPRFVFLFSVALTAIMLNSCQSAQKASDSESVEPAQLEGYWVLKTINGNEAKSVFTTAQPTLVFDFHEMRISGTGGCNSYTGAFTLEKNVMLSSEIALTRMLCLENIPEQEFIDALAKSKTLNIENGVLTMTNGEGIAVLAFEKVTKD